MAEQFERGTTRSGSYWLDARSRLKLRRCFDLCERPFLDASMSGLCPCADRGIVIGRVAKTVDTPAGFYPFFRKRINCVIGMNCEGMAADIDVKPEFVGKASKKRERRYLGISSRDRDIEGSNADFVRQLVRIAT